MKTFWMTAIATVMMATTVQAQGSLRLGVPAYGGTGCPAGSASVSVSPDQSAVSILFDQFLTEAGNTTRRRIDRKSCNFAIPVQVPQGYSVALFAVDYRGYNAVPRGGYNRLDAEYFWAGTRGPRISRQFNGPLNDVYTVTDRLIATALVWSACGASTTLRVNASMMSMTNARNEQTLGTVDSADVSSGLIYRLQWRRCR